MQIQKYYYLICATVLLNACATRPINPAIDHVTLDKGYRFSHPTKIPKQDPETLLMLAFSGGGTRASAFSYGVLEALRATPIEGKAGATSMLDEVDYITGVSGGSFTALAYGLYGEKLFDQYESRFLKRDVQGTLFGKWLNPINWPNLWQLNYSRSEMSQDYYDEILFNNATFADLEKKGGPRILVSATEASTGYRFTFNQDFFDLICSDLSQVKLSRAAVSSSAVPIIFNPVTFHNYGKQCGENIPAWAEEALKKTSTNSDLPSRTLQRLRELKVLSDSEERPYLHLADGGISDNLGARIILELLETLPVLQAERESKGAPPLRNIAFIIVNSLSYPKVNWGKSAVPPSEVGMAMRAMGTPIDQYSYETISLIEDIAKSINKSPQLQGKLNGQAGLPINVTPIVLSFMQVADEKERDYFNNLPTSFRLAEEEVDQLRKLGGVLLKGSTQYKNLIKQLQAK